MTSDLRPGQPASPGELVRAKALRAARNDELSVVRVAAGKWQAGLAGLLGVVTGSTVLTIGESISSMEAGWAIVTAAVVGFSVLSAVVSIYLALRASGGTPKPRLTKSFDPSVESHVEARSVAADLGIAITVGMVSLVLFAVAVTLTWFAPAGDSGSDGVLLVVTQDGVLCGIPEFGAGNLLVLTDAGGQSLQVFGAEIASLAVLEKCP